MSRETKLKTNKYHLQINYIQPNKAKPNKAKAQKNIKKCCLVKFHTLFRDIIFFSCKNYNKTKKFQKTYIKIKQYNN